VQTPFTTPTPTRTITFKKITSVADIKPVKNDDIVTKVRNYATISIVKPTTQKAPTKPGIWSEQGYGNPVPYVAPTPKATVKKSSSGGSGSRPSGTWGGTGSLKATTSLSAGEKQKKGITGSSYTQGSVKAPRPAKSYNTGKTTVM
jgi:hypothetical protein